LNKAVETGLSLFYIKSFYVHTARQVFLVRMHGRNVGYQHSTEHNREKWTYIYVRDKIKTHIFSV